MLGPEDLVGLGGGAEAFLCDLSSTHLPTPAPDGLLFTRLLGWLFGD